MSNFITKAILQTRYPVLEFRRFRGKINIQRPQKPHYERARVIAVTQPIYKKDPPTKTCFDDSHLTFKIKPHNPYNDIIAREVLNWFNHSKMIGIFHLNPISGDDMFKIRVALHKQNMYLKSYGKAIFKLALKNTIYEAILPLFESNHCIVFSPETKMKELLNTTKKCSQMILMAGIAENRLLSKNEFTNAAGMPDLQTVRGQFVGVLQSAAGNIVNNLEAHQKAFVNALDIYAKLDSSQNQSQSDQSSESKTEDKVTNG